VCSSDLDAPPGLGSCFLVSLHEATGTDHVGGKDRGEAAG
jgi:hypothetical protein